MYSIYFANTINNWSLNASFKIERNTLTSAKENSFSSPPSWISLLSASMKIIMFCQLQSFQLNSCTLGCKIHHNGYIEQGDTSWCWFKRMNNPPASHICLQSKVLQNLQPPLCQVFFWLCIFFNVDKHRIFNCTVITEEDCLSPAIPCFFYQAFSSCVQCSISSNSWISFYCWYQKRIVPCSS